MNMLLVQQPRSREFALMLSRRCNIECRHCGIESTPKIKDKMALDEARRLIVEAALIPEIGKVTFTGGEPFMFPSELEDLLLLCRGLGLGTRVVTNGFWAKTKERGRKLLKQMCDAGLTEINFSADRFHLEFLDPQTLRNALDCAKQLGLTRIVSFVSNADEDPLTEFSALYGIRREELYDLRLLGTDLKRIGEMGRTHILVFYGGLIGLGRAARECGDELRYFPIDFFPQRQSCMEVVNKPVVYPDGSFQACCCAGGKIKSFTVGNVRDDTLETLFERMLSRPHFRLINTLGPRALWESVRAQHPEINLPTSYSSICELCVCATTHLSAAEADAVAERSLVEATLRELGVPIQDGSRVKAEAPVT
jgi:MoaA/NifB/PqqE/SkfB family radical SAM enzyme